jgi:hypothetical protein
MRQGTSWGQCDELSKLIRDATGCYLEFAPLVLVGFSCSEHAAKPRTAEQILADIVEHWRRGARIEPLILEAEASVPDGTPDLGGIDG